MRRRCGLSPILIFVALSSAFGCSGQGCSCMAPIPGGFNPADRTANAAQVRVSDTGISSLTTDPAALVSGLLGGPLQFNVPSSCGGSPAALCCPGGQAQQPCGPLNIDLAAQPGDDARLVVTPVQGQSHIDVTMRARVTTLSPIPINVFGDDCEMIIDSTATSGSDPYPDLEIVAPINLDQDTTTGTTRVDVGAVTVNRFTSDDFTIQEPGGPSFPFLCEGINWGVDQATGTLASTFASQIKSAIQNQTCKACPSGDVSECGPFAQACTNNVCIEDPSTSPPTCLQELGVEGRLAGVFGGFSPGTTGAMDLYEVAGGYAQTDNGGVSLGMLGGMDPAGTPHDQCGPPATPPTPAVITPSAYFQGNTRPDTGASFDVAFGLHKSQLDQFAYAGYNGGLLCLTIDDDTVSLLNTGEFSLFLPSLGDLAPSSKPMAIGLRPQSPPVITLGTNTFNTDGQGNVTVADPLMLVHFTQMEIDFFAAVEDQYVRLFTLVADVDLPVGLQVGADGSLTPVLGDVHNAFTNISVKNSEALRETPDQLAGIFPSILSLALGQLGQLGSFQVPTLAGLHINVTDITSVDNLSYLAIFGNLAAAKPEAARVDTTASITSIDMPDASAFADPTRWKSERPRVHLALGGSDAGLEWSVRTDDGWWSAWSKSPDETISPDSFLVEGRHTIEVRARKIGDSWSTDETPVRLSTVIDTQAPVVGLERDGGAIRIHASDNVAGPIAVRWRLGDGDWTNAPSTFEVPLLGHAASDLQVEATDVAGLVASVRGADEPVDTSVAHDFHGAPTQSGCGCNAGSPGTGGLVLVMIVMFGLRRRRGAQKRLAFLLTAGLMPACNCGGNNAACGDKACMPGEVAHGAIGKWNSVASDGTRTVVSTYDSKLGDLVLVDEVPGGDPVLTAIDGVPDETPTYDPSTYRGGIATAGPNVGAYTSIVLSSEGLARIAYQDLDNSDLKYATEDETNGWTSYVLDGDDTSNVGVQSSLALDQGGAPAIAYCAVGVANGNTREVDLRLAHASSVAPADASGWTISSLDVAAAPVSCAGLCGTSGTCVADATGAQSCQGVTTDCTTACTSAQVCVSGTCEKKIADPAADNVQQGAGLFPNLLTLSDGRMAIVYYDRVHTALGLLLQDSPGGTSWTQSFLDGADDSDRGMWATAITDGTTIYAAYQEARGDELYYVTWNGTAGTPELVDDGVRSGDRPHNVGAGATIFLDGNTPKIAYQDGLTANLVLAVRNGTWSHSDIATGDVLDGFHTASTSTGPWLVWDNLDKTRSPVGDLEAREMP